MNKSEDSKRFEKEQLDLGYQVPSDYFPEFADEFMHSLTEYELARSHEEELGLKSPENYFKNSRQSIINAISGEEKSDKHKFKSHYRKLWPSAVAAIFLFGFVMFFDFDKSAQNAPDPNIVDTYIEDESPFFDQEDLATLYDEMVLESIFMHDSEVDDYIQDYVFENMLLEDVLLE